MKLKENNLFNYIKYLDETGEEDFNSLYSELESAFNALPGAKTPEEKKKNLQQFFDDGYTEELLSKSESDLASNMIVFSLMSKIGFDDKMMDNVKKAAEMGYLHAMEKVIDYLSLMEEDDKNELNQLLVDFRNHTLSTMKEVSPDNSNDTLELYADATTLGLYIYGMGWTKEEIIERTYPFIHFGFHDEQDRKFENWLNSMLDSEDDNNSASEKGTLNN